MSWGIIIVSGDIKVEKGKMKWDLKILEIWIYLVEKIFEFFVY